MDFGMWSSGIGLDPNHVLELWSCLQHWSKWTEIL